MAKAWAKNGCQTTSDQAYFQGVTCWQENQQQWQNHAQAEKREFSYGFFKHTYIVCY